jgi:putative ABC transport system permease protein
MRGGDYLGYTWRNVRRARLRVLLTVLAVVIGATLVVVMSSVGGGIERNVLEGIRSVGGLNEILVQGVGTAGPGGVPVGRAGGLSDGLVEEIAALPGVRAVLPVLAAFGMLELRYDDLTAQPIVVAAPPERLAAYGLPLAAGTATPAPGEVVLGARVGEQFFDAQRRRAAPLALFGQSVRLSARRLGLPPGGVPPGGIPGGLPGLPNLAPAAAPTFERELRVVGVLDGQGTQDDFTAWLHPSDLLDALEFMTGRRPDLATDGYSVIRVKATSIDQVRAVQQALLARDLQATSPLSVLDQVNQGLRILQLLLATIGLVALIVSGLGVANTMLMATFERTREIGILKALGATEGQIATLFLLEASAIGLLGATIGLVLGWLASQLISFVVLQLLVAQTGSAPDRPLTVLYTPAWVVPVVLGAAWGIAALAGLYPALRAAHLNIAQALRSE